MRTILLQLFSGQHLRAVLPVHLRHAPVKGGAGGRTIDRAPTNWLGDGEFCFAHLLRRLLWPSLLRHLGVAFWTSYFLCFTYTRQTSVSLLFAVLHILSITNNKHVVKMIVLKLLGSWVFWVAPQWLLYGCW